MKMIKETQYLDFVDAEIEEIKTKVVVVFNKHHQQIIGEIRWFSKWRQYCFFPCTDTIWNITCLTEVNAVIKQLMDERKK